MSADTVCDVIADVACFNLYQCCSENEIEDFLQVSDPRTQDECREDVRTRCERKSASIDFSVKNNRIAFKADVLRGCLEALEAPEGTCATVATMLPWAEACLDSAWIGVVMTDAQCYNAIECVPGDVCGAGHTCTPGPDRGMACVNGRCGRGLFCDMGTCRYPLDEGGLCASSAECPKGRFCDTTAPTPTCVKQHEVGETCTGDETCASGICLPGICAGSRLGCISDADCSGRCAGLDDRPCSDDGDCGSVGTCSDTATPCYSDLNCASATCVFPVHCLPPQCTGYVVCAEPQVAVDYCRGALMNLPFP